MSAPEAAEPGQGHVAPCEERALRVLLVEDDASARLVFADMLELLGHWCAAVSSAEAAQARYFEGAFDVLMCDNRLPGLSGLDLVQTLKSSGMGVVMVSGGPRPDGLPAGCEWLAKPFGMAALGQSLQRAARAARPDSPTTDRAQPRVGEGKTGTSSPGGTRPSCTGAGATTSPSVCGAAPAGRGAGIWGMTAPAAGSGAGSEVGMWDGAAPSSAGAPA